MSKETDMQKEKERINDIIEYYKSGGTRKTYIGEEFKKHGGPIIQLHNLGRKKNKYIEEEMQKDN